MRHFPTPREASRTSWSAMTSSKLPVATTTPLCITTTRSLRRATISRSCSTKMIDRPRSRWARRRTWPMATDSRESRPDDGSSAKSTRELTTNERASSTHRQYPRLSVPTTTSAYSPRPTNSNVSSAAFFCCCDDPPLLIKSPRSPVAPSCTPWATTR